YLYPLLSLGFLAAYFFHGPFWKRAIVLLSAVPITIFMNSIRIGLVGVLVNRWGTQAAEGLLHFFEGWTIFIASAGLLMGVMALLARLGNKSLVDVFSMPVLSVERTLFSKPSRIALLTSLAMLCGGAGATYLLSNRQEIIPERQRFIAFPSWLGAWQGRP